MFIRDAREISFSGRPAARLRRNTSAPGLRWINIEFRGQLQRY